MNLKRVNQQKDVQYGNGPVIYWMQRDQRGNDNWALIYAIEKAKELKTQPIVIFCLVPTFLQATLRQYGFMLKGLEEVEKSLTKFNIPFYLLLGEPGSEIPKFVKRIKASALISDFNPLRVVRNWKKEVIAKLDIPFFTVDAHNIVPAWEVSNKQEFGAYTIRPKIKRQLDQYLDEFPKLVKQKSHDIKSEKVDWNNARKKLKINFDVNEVDWIKPGEKAALKILDSFFEERLSGYNEKRNDPNENVSSNLSPYLHFGQISAQRIALETYKRKHNIETKDAFLEELIVRRELSDNFCFYNKNYDSFDGFPEWAKKTLNEHRKDKREFTYNLEQFEKAKTHDDLWNAAQIEMVKTGKMHGYMRMYWAKKILEWTETPEEALEFSIYLNDKYELDGRDPNGYTGCAWSIGGVHDRAWTERPVFGKIRYMNYNGAKRKFDVKRYIQKYL